MPIDNCKVDGPTALRLRVNTAMPSSAEPVGLEVAVASAENVHQRESSDRAQLPSRLRIGAGIGKSERNGLQQLNACLLPSAKLRQSSSTAQTMTKEECSCIVQEADCSWATYQSCCMVLSLGNSRYDEE
jgi:hypothetical protein